MPRTTLLLAALLLVPACKGKGSRAPEAGAAQDSTAMGGWEAWLELRPLLAVARGHAPAKTVGALEQASKLLQGGKAKTADRGLSALADSEGRHWITSPPASAASSGGSRT
jgi:hypothetical protein